MKFLDEFLETIQGIDINDTIQVVDFNNNIYTGLFNGFETINHGSWNKVYLRQCLIQRDTSKIYKRKFKFKKIDDVKQVSFSRIILFEKKPKKALRISKEIIRQCFR